MRLWIGAALCAGAMALSGQALSATKSISVDAGPGYFDFLARPLTLTRIAADRVELSTQFNGTMRVIETSEFTNVNTTTDYSGVFTLSGTISLEPFLVNLYSGAYGPAQVTATYTRATALFDSFSADFLSDGSDGSFQVDGTGLTGDLQSWSNTCVGPTLQCTNYLSQNANDFRGQFSGANGNWSDSSGFAIENVGDTINSYFSLYFVDIDPWFFTDEPSIGQTYAASLAGMYYRTVYENVPEPSTWAIMILGFFSLGAALRRQKSSLLRREGSAPATTLGR
jgi:hypothetical protein